MLFLLRERAVALAVTSKIEQRGRACSCDRRRLGAKRARDQRPLAPDMTHR
jgi:hypothetical protein